MSELINKHSAGNGLRRHLLTTASALVLVACRTLSAAADEADHHPSIWIELGGQLERQTGQGDVYPVPFVAAYPDSFAFEPVSPIHLERPSLYSNGFEGSISFEPDRSNWVLSASVRYGRSGRNNDIHQGRNITEVEQFTRYPRYDYANGGWLLPRTGTFIKSLYEFGGTQVQQSESHTVVDFSAGKDVGLGMLGRGSSSLLSLGVRFAQFVSKSSTTIHARPDAIFTDPCGAATAAYFAPIFPSHDFKFCFPGSPTNHIRSAHSESYRNFRGIGPSISWKASVPVLGNPDDEALMVDWGVNAAVLFGRQRASGVHQTSGRYYGLNGIIGSNGFPPTQYTRVAPFNRSRSVIVPNVGGLIGASLKFPNAKISLGYRGDFFFGAMDTSFDTRKTKTVGFYGPFATISFGLGG